MHEKYVNYSIVQDVMVRVRLHESINVNDAKRMVRFLARTANAKAVSDSLGSIFNAF